MINHRVDSHGNHRGSGVEREEVELLWRVKATLAKYTKMIAHKGIFVIKKRIVYCTISSYNQYSRLYYYSIADFVNSLGFNFVK